MEQKDHLIKDSMILFIASSVVNIVNFIFHSYASRLLGPEKYGVLVTLLAFIVIAGMPAMALQMTIVKRTSIFKAHNQFGSVEKLFKTTILWFSGIGILYFILFAAMGYGVGGLKDFFHIEDNAIIILQTIAHKARKLKVFNTEKLVVESTQELVLPMLASTVSTIIVFLPLVFLDEEIKRLYVPFGMAIAISLTAALICTLIFLPPLCIRVKNSFTFEPPAWDKIVSGLYVKILNFVFRKQKIVFSAIAVLSIATALIFMTRDSEFIDPGNANTFRVGIQFPPGSRIERSDAIVKKIEKALIKYPAVIQVSSRIEKLHTFLEVKVRDQKETLKDTFRKRFGEFSPAFIYYQESQEMSSQEVFVDFYGYDYGVLKQLAFSASGRLSQMHEFSDVKIRMREDEPELAYYVYQNKLAHFGISTLYLANTIHNQLRGLVATYFRTEGKELETIARLTPGTVASAADLPYLKFFTPYGDLVSLNQLGDIKQVTTTQEIWHKNKKRFIQISANRGKMGLTSAVDKMRVALSALNFPKDYSFEFSGDYEKAVKNKKDFSVAILLTVILIYLTLASLFESYVQPLLIMTSLPLSAIGVGLMLFIFKKPISLGIWIGMMILGGTVVNASIILVEKINQTRVKKGLLRSIMESSKERLHSVLMTSLNNIIGLIPLVVSTSDASSMWRSLGLAVMAGMFSGTFLTLFLLPTFYYRTVVPLKLSDILPKFNKKPVKLLPKVLPTLQSDDSIVAKIPQVIMVNKKQSIVRKMFKPIFIIISIPGKVIKKIFGPGKKLLQKKPLEFTSAIAVLVAKVKIIANKKHEEPMPQIVDTLKQNESISKPCECEEVIPQQNIEKIYSQDEIKTDAQVVKEYVTVKEVVQEITPQGQIEEKIVVKEEPDALIDPIVSQEPLMVITKQEKIDSTENAKLQISKENEEIKDIEQIKTEPSGVVEVTKVINNKLTIDDLLPQLILEENKTCLEQDTKPDKVEQIDLVRQQETKQTVVEKIDEQQTTIVNTDSDIITNFENIERPKDVVDSKEVIQSDIVLNVSKEDIDEQDIEKQKEDVPISKVTESKVANTKPKKTFIQDIFGIEPLTQEQKENQKKPIDIIKDILANLFGSTKKRRDLIEEIEIKYKSEKSEKVLTETKEYQQEEKKDDKGK